MKRIFAIILVICLSVAVIVGGCAAPAPAAKPAPSPAPAPAPAPAKTWELKMHHHTSGAFLKDGVEAWAKKFGEATNNQVTVKVYPFLSLGGVTQGYDLVTSGTADVAWTVTGFYPGQFMMSDMMTLPFVTCPNTEKASMVMWDYVEQFPKEFAKEYGEVKLLTIHNGDPTMVGTTKKPIKTMEDMQGLNIRANAGPQTDFAKALKANPQMVGVGDAYDAMSKGVIEGFISDWPAVESFKWYEIVKYYLEPYINHNVFWLIINKDKWNAFPADVQAKIMNACGGKAGAQFFGKVWDGIANNTKKLVKGMPDREISSLSKDEAARWKALAKPIYDAYVAKVEAKGLPGKQALDYLLKQVDASWK